MNKLIHINWEGPFSLDEALEKGKESFGIYQYSGTHLSYGSNALLYIGKACDQSFSKRIDDHVHHEWSATPIQIFFGKIANQEKLTNDQWREYVGLAEELIIYSHSPAWNSQCIKSINFDKFDGVHIFNWGHLNKLLPEVSYERWRNIGNKLPESLIIQK